MSEDRHHRCRQSQRRCLKEEGGKEGRQAGGRRGRERESEGEASTAGVGANKQAGKYVMLHFVGRSTSERTRTGGRTDGGTTASICTCGARPAAERQRWSWAQTVGDGTAESLMDQRSERLAQLQPNFDSYQLSYGYVRCSYSFFMTSIYSDLSNNGLCVAGSRQ